MFRYMHITSAKIRLDLTKRLEQTQYSAALALAYVWIIASKDNLVYAFLQSLGYINFPNALLTHLTLYGDKDFPSGLNENILELTL